MAENPFFEAGYDFALANIALAVTSTAEDAAIVTNEIDGKRVILVRVGNDGTPEGFTWWAMGYADVQGQVEEAFEESAPLSNDTHLVKAVEERWQSAGDGIRNAMKQAMEGGN